MGNHGPTKLMIFGTETACRNHSHPHLYLHPPPHHHPHHPHPQHPPHNHHHHQQQHLITSDNQWSWMWWWQWKYQMQTPQIGSIKTKPIGSVTLVSKALTPLLNCSQKRHGKVFCGQNVHSNQDPHSGNPTWQWTIPDLMGYFLFETISRGLPNRACLIARRWSL